MRCLRALVAVLAPCLLLSQACSSAAGGGSGLSSAIIGSWNLSDGHYDPNSGYRADEACSIDVLFLLTKMQFRSDGQVVDPDSGGSGTYSFPDSSHLKLQGVGGSGLLGITITGETMTLSSGANRCDYRRTSS
jgi:hypothetical protein